MGFEMVITNAYITMRNHGEEAAKRGIHDIIGFDGAVMTDSGGYQVLEYGGLDTTPEEMAHYERQIGSDIAIPLDKPTGFGLPRRIAAGYVRQTLADSRATLEAADIDGQLWAGPIQGGEHLGLVARSARELAKMGFPVMALGSPVEFMEQYEYARLAQMITAARRAIPPSLPLHLFGSGHPLTISLSVALGCDTFDSASYALYARHGRYISEDGTRRLEEMAHFSCLCPACSGRTPPELGAEEPGERYRLLSLHNLYAIKAEVDRVAESVSEGRLWEYTIKKLRAHPRLYEALAVLRDGADHISYGTPRFKPKAALLFGAEDLWRPEVRAYCQMVRRFKTPKKSLCLVREPTMRPAYLDGGIIRLEDILGPGVQICLLSAHLGAVPLELSDIYPAAHHLAAAGAENQTRDHVLGTIQGIIDGNAFEQVVYDRSDPYIAGLVRRLPRGIARAPLPKKKRKKRAEQKRS